MAAVDGDKVALFFATRKDKDPALAKEKKEMDGLRNIIIDALKKMLAAQGNISLLTQKWHKKIKKELLLHGNDLRSGWPQRMPR